MKKSFLGLLLAFFLSGSLSYGGSHVDGSKLNETFDSVTPLDGAVPSGWYVEGNASTNPNNYIGVTDLNINSVVYRGLYLQNLPTSTQGSVHTPNLGNLGGTFGVEFDFNIRDIAAKDFMLLSPARSGYPLYNKFLLNGDSTNGYTLKDLAGNVVANLTTGILYHLSYISTFSSGTTGTYRLYLDNDLIATGSNIVLEGQNAGTQYFVLGSKTQANGGTVFYDNFKIGAELPDPYVPAASLVDGNVLDENFDSITPGDGVLPASWSTSGHTYTYIGVKDVAFSVGGTLRGLYLQNVMANSNGSVYTLDMGPLGSNFGVEFDFALMSNVQNFVLLGSYLSSSWNIFNKITATGNESTGYDIYNVAGTSAAHISAGTLHRLAYITTMGTYKLYLDGEEIASGNCIVRPDGNVRKIFMGSTVTADGGAVFYDNFKVGSLGETRQNQGFDVPAISAITVDGDLSDWSDSSPWSKPYIWWNGTALTSTTKAKFAYNKSDDMLYVAISTTQENGGHAVVGVSKNIESIPAEGEDSTQLGFTGNGGSVTIINEINELMYYGMGGMVTTDVQAACVQQIDGSWLYEIAIPLWKAWTDDSQGKEDLVPGDKIYVYSMMQDAYGTNPNGMNLTYYGNPGFSNGAFDEASELKLAGGDTYPMGWCSTYPNVTVEDPGKDGANIIWAQDWGTGTHDDIIAYLDTAQSLGVKVILQLPQDAVEGNDQTTIQNFVELVCDHSALYGFELSDEPSADDATVLAAAYTTIKSISDKPVTITFSLGAYQNGTMAALANYCDIIIQDTYAHFVDQDEFVGCLDKWKYGVGFASDGSVESGKPFWMMGQAFSGLVDSGTGFTWRLPTYDEERFCDYWAVLNGAQGVVHWIRHKTLDSAAISGQPYPYSGTQWINDVLSPVMNEFKLFSNAFSKGAISGAVTSSNSNVKAAVYADDDGNYYLIAANGSGSSVSSTLTLNLPFTPVWAIPTHEASDAKGITTNGSTSSINSLFTACQVLTYRIVPETSTGFTTATGSFLIEDFNSILPGDGSVPTNWTIVGNGDQYIGVKEISGKTGLYLENTPGTTDGSVYMPSTVETGNRYGVEFDFVVYDTCQNFWLVAAYNSTSGVFNKILVSGTQLYDLAGTSAATLTTGKLYHLSYVTDNGSYKIYLDGTQIASGTSATGNAQQIVLGTDITADGGSVFYDNIKVGTIVPTGTPVILTPGDANKDGVVNVGDLGILAANYGRDLEADDVAQAEWWGLGDFNGDGTVNVGDLGILAANYGSSGSSFEADYAKVFGTAAAEDESDEPDSFCSGFGLPLIAGLMLMGLMMVKNEE